MNNTRPPVAVISSSNKIIQVQLSTFDCMPPFGQVFSAYDMYDRRSNPFALSSPEGFHHGLGYPGAPNDFAGRSALSAGMHAGPFSGGPGLSWGGRALDSVMHNHAGPMRMHAHSPVGDFILRPPFSLPQFQRHDLFDDFDISDSEDDFSDSDSERGGGMYHWGRSGGRSNFDRHRRRSLRGLFY